MPIYEYECADCGNRFEALVRGNDRPKCPECKSKHLEKLMSASATHSGTNAAPACAAKRAGACHETGCPGGCCHGR